MVPLDFRQWVIAVSGTTVLEEVTACYEDGSAATGRPEAPDLPARSIALGRGLRALLAASS